jgi:hypothetical protein
MYRSRCFLSTLMKNRPEQGENSRIVERKCRPKGEPDRARLHGAANVPIGRIKGGGPRDRGRPWYA